MPTLQKKIYYSTADVATALGLTVDAARKWAIRNKVARKVGGRWKVTEERFIAAFPEAFQRLAH